MVNIDDQEEEFILEKMSEDREEEKEMRDKKLIESQLNDLEEELKNGSRDECLNREIDTLRWVLGYKKSIFEEKIEVKCSSCGEYFKTTPKRMGIGEKEGLYVPIYCQECIDKNKLNSVFVDDLNDVKMRTINNV